MTAAPFDVLVIGGGPAGSTIAARLAQLGHRVCVVERERFPRRHLGESLTPGVLPILEASGARTLVESAGFPPVTHLDVDWGGGPVRRPTPAGAGGLVVDRGRFDALLLDHARAAGAEVLQPAAARRPELRDGAWHVPVDSERGRADVAARFVVVAAGRTARTRPLESGRPTLAFHAWWTGDRLPAAPRIEAGEDGWCWGVPVPDGTWNTLVFVDQEEAAAGPREAPAARFHRLVRASGLLRGCEGLRLAGPVRAAVATPRLAAESVTPNSIRVGDAALALDPLSSSGVQKALQTAVSGAIVVNTLLRAPECADAAMEFHRDALRRAYDRHASWAAGHYATAGRTGPFWRHRAGPSPETPPADAAARADWASSAPVGVSRGCRFVDVPCLGEELVTRRTAVTHPGLGEPVAYVAGQELAPLLRSVPAGATALAVAQAWSRRVPARTAFAIVDWLVARGVLHAGTGLSAAPAALYAVPPGAGGPRPAPGGSDDARTGDTA